VVDSLPATPVSQTPLTLPDGSQLPFSKGTMEFKLFEFINDAGKQAGKDVWFDFDDINFDLGSDNISASSNIQLENVARILKAYPRVKVKVGGYTDRSGDSATNMQLSQKRAEAVVSALKRFGVPDAQLVGAEGYGSQFATMPATASEEERRIDRRMAISVREK
jgi:outer membrane protein OmpA-like peptidoglycan-associated protein